MDTIIKIAAGELGVKEFQGSAHNPRILEYQEMTGLKFESEDVAWCSIFANWVALQAGSSRSNSALARSWQKVGRKTSFPRPGDVVVMWRHAIDDWRGHVGFFMGYNHALDEVFVLGGNQNNAVTISSYDISRVLSFRRLKSDLEAEIPTGYLRIGESNERVQQLQVLLIDLDYLSGTADGVFGSGTEEALIQFQTDNNITVDGIYGSETRGAFEAILG